MPSMRRVRPTSGLSRPSPGKHLSRWIEQNGQRAVIKAAAGSYMVRGKSGITAGHLWKAKDAWMLQMHASPPESFSSAKAAKAAALEYALRY
jgi:hypothetical protein